MIKTKYHQSEALKNKSEQAIYDTIRLTLSQKGLEKISQIKDKFHILKNVSNLETDRIDDIYDLAIIDYKRILSGDIDMSFFHKNHAYEKE
jgi:hypothetical protein